MDARTEQRARLDLAFQIYTHINQINPRNTRLIMENVPKCLEKSKTFRVLRRISDKWKKKEKECSYTVIVCTGDDVYEGDNCCVVGIPASVSPKIQIVLLALAIFVAATVLISCSEPRSNFLHVA